MTFTENLTLALVSGLLAGLVTAAVSYFGFWRQAKAELQKEYETKYTERKWEAYLKIMNLASILHERVLVRMSLHTFEELLDPNRSSYMQNGESMSSYVENMRAKQELLTKEIDAKANIIENEILLIGSPEVIQTYRKWEVRVRLSNVKTFDDFAKDVFIELLNQMRKDLGKEESDLDSKMLEEYFIPGT